MKIPSLLRHAPLGLAMTMLLLLAAPAQAHKPSDSYLKLQAQESTLRGSWSIALRDLEITAGLDANHDRKIIWGEVKAKQPTLQELMQKNLSFTTPQGPCPLAFSDLLVDELSDGHYAVLTFSAACPQAIERLTVSDNFLYDRDAQHKNLVSLTAGEEAQSTILSADVRQVTLNAHGPGILSQMKEYVRQGMVHIWLGYDHLLFLIALLLPAAWVYQRGVPQTDAPFGAVFRESFIFISAFTVAHALTLGLALFDLLHVPSRLTESLIALSIMVSCFNNLRPFLKQRLWLLTFGFGLIHGMGFATTLAELGLGASARWIALLGFNIGVEFGQLVVAGVLLPIFFTMRTHPAYRMVIVRGFSCLIFALACLWFIQRAFAVVLFPALLY
jgi:hypothetical protein